jgi:hypothetical protein
VSRPPSLSELLGQRHNFILRNLQDASSFVSHPTEKGDATEQVWLDALETYLPARYDVRRGFAIDSCSNYSKQIDIIVHDRFYTPFLLKVGGYHVVPVESIYAVFEVKQLLNSQNIKFAQDKAQSVRVLQRRYRQTKEVTDESGKHILTGVLATRSAFSEPLGNSAISHMLTANEDERLDYVCVGESGLAFRSSGELTVESSGSWITSFILNLVGALQSLGTVPPIDMAGYRSGAQ